MIPPIGRPESATLEFKSGEARPVDIAREVVAFLNAGGGEIWWGVKEDRGRGAALDPFRDGRERIRDLQNHVVDTLEPSPLSTEVLYHQVDVGDGDVIRVEVRKPEAGRRPVAQVKDHGRRYWIRVGDRIRVMSREELAAAFRATPAEPRGLEDRLLEERTAIQAADDPCFWMKLVPDPPLDGLDLQDRRLQELLMDPAATHNRHAGWNFVLELSMPRPTSTGLWQGVDQKDYVEIKRSGAIEFRVPLERLHWKGDEQVIWPYALIEFPVSLFRLAARLYAEWGSGVRVVLVDFAFVRLQGWSLRRGSPRQPMFGRAPAIFRGRDLVPDPILRFQRDEIVKEPDLCGLRVIRRIYEAFGWREEDIPPELNPSTGAFVVAG